MIRSAMIALALVAGFGVAAHADVVVKSQDGSMELTLPSGWKEVPPRGPNTKLQASTNTAPRLRRARRPKKISRTSRPSPIS